MKQNNLLIRKQDVFLKRLNSFHFGGVFNRKKKTRLRNLDKRYLTSTIEILLQVSVSKDFILFPKINMQMGKIGKTGSFSSFTFQHQTDVNS